MTTEPRPFDDCPECKGDGVATKQVGFSCIDGAPAVFDEPCSCIRRRVTVPADIAQAATDEFLRVHEQDGTTWGEAIDSALQVAFGMLPEQSWWVERVDPKTPALLDAVDKVIGHAAHRYIGAHHEYGVSPRHFEHRQGGVVSNELKAGNVWTALAPAEPELEPADPCPTGFENHTWRFTIEEGQATFAPVEDCNGECAWWDPEAIGYLDLGVVRLSVENEHGDGSPLGGWHGMTRCECSYWIAPAPITAGDWPQRRIESEALQAIVEGVRALRRRGGTATEMFAALDHYDKVMGK